MLALSQYNRLYFLFTPVYNRLYTIEERTMQTLMITGHTGHDGTTDNSLDSVRMSITLGVDAVEMDVRRDGDSVLVLSHDECRGAPYKSYPELSSVFEILRDHPGIRINCDLKEEALPLEVIDLASRSGIAADRLILTGLVDLPYLDAHPEIVRMAEVYLNAENVLEEEYFRLSSENGPLVSRRSYYAAPWKHLREVVPSLTPYIGLLSDTCLEYGVKGINIPYQCLTDDNIRELKKKGTPLSVWTVNTEEEIVRFLSQGVENLTTRRAGMAKSIRKDLFGY